MSDFCQDWEKEPEPLHTWFGLSYAHWLTLPRVLMQEMSQDWQSRMVKLLEEFDETWNWRPEDGRFFVQFRKHNGRWAPLPNFGGYRHPDRDIIRKLERKPKRR